MSLSLPQEVFLSHASADAAFASSVASTLRRHGIPVWYSATNIVGARQWHDEIGGALARCDWFVVLLSSAAVGSMWVKREVLYALQQRRYEDRIVPVLYEPCAFEHLSWVLSSIQLIDFRTDVEAGYRALLRTWGVGYAPRGG